MESDNRNQRREVNLSPRDQKALDWGSWSGVVLIVMIALFGSEELMRADFVMDLAPWIPCLAPWFGNDVAAPVGVVTGALFAMRYFEKKPTDDLKILVSGLGITILSWLTVSDAVDAENGWMTFVGGLLTVSPAVVCALAYSLMHCLGLCRNSSANGEDSR